mmetsp:Transcript_9599/g.11521  ORF Transcript_9599/g.11521 Transcript_9599/m.11521 type:complete len:405 (-) Transcript_9599:1207-2421(-)
MSFLFQTARGILCELGSARRIGNILSEDLSIAKGSSVLFVTDAGIQQLQLDDGARQSIAEAGIQVNVFSDVVADPHEDCVHEAVRIAKSTNAAAIVGFGGGSSLDVAKLAAFLAHKDCQQNLSEIYGLDMCKGERLPLIQVPTTAGTGSEVTPISIITTGENSKMGVVSRQLLPDWAVLDGSLTTKLPPMVTAATGIDAMVHAIEAYTSKIKKNDLSDLLAKEALRLLGGNIEHVCINGNDQQARSDMLLGSLYAGMAFANAPVGGVHALAYPIGSHFKVPHGLSNAMMLPHVMEFNMQSERATKQYAELAPIVFPHIGDHFGAEANHAQDDESRNNLYAGKMIEELMVLSKKLNVETSLSSAGIMEKDLDLLAEESMKQTRLLRNNPVNILLKDARDLYAKAL